ncbi:MAG: class I adenylate-forming enzyme family protein [Pseudomonadota bacterium]
MLSVFDQGPPAPCPSPFNMAAYVLAQAERLGDKPSLIAGGTGGDVLTFQQLRSRVRAVAGGLRAQGLTPGSKVLFRLGNSSRFPVAYLACIWAGLVPVPTSAQLTVDEITTIAAEVSAAAILADAGVSLPETEDCPVLTNLPEAAPIPADLGDPNRLAYIIFTSGTAGKPRGVCHAHRAIWARRMMHDGWYALRTSDRVMHAGAFNWTYTLGTGLMDPWSVGATAIIAQPETQSADLIDLALLHDVSIFAAAPGVYRQILKAELPMLPKLRHALSAGEHLSETLRDMWKAKTGTALHQAFGMSECSTFISSSPARPAPPNSSGTPQPGRCVAVLDKGEPVPCGAPGALAVSVDDPGLMLHYLGGAAPEGRWFETGDIASMQEDGSVTYLGRADDMMNAGGYRVFPLEVEACFADCGGVTASAAVQVEIKSDTSVIALFYLGNAREQALRAHAQTHLARYKQPRLYIPVSALPYGGNGKLNRRALRANYEAQNVRTD